MGSTTFGAGCDYLHISTLRWPLGVSNGAANFINSVGHSAAAWQWIYCLLVLGTTYYAHLTTADAPTNSLHIMYRPLNILQFAAAVEVLAAVDGVVRSHPLDDKAILNDLIHIRFFTMQTLLNLVIGLLNQPGVLIEIDARQIIVRLLCKGTLLP